MHISKNSKCPCGSGRRYQKCCKPKVIGPSPAVLAAAKKHFQKKWQEQSLYREQFGEVRQPVSTMFNGKRVIAIGGSLYIQKEVGEYTFLQAIHDHALSIFGDERLAAEEALEQSLRHPALQWMHAFVDAHQQALEKGGAADLSGAGAAWHRFSYDLFSIQDNAALHKVMVHRLLNPNNFQGARYELWVAALWVAAGFDIHYEDESDGTRKHPEFIAKDKSSDLVVAVEAKSRHRKGVKGFSLGKEVPHGSSVGIRDLLIDALQKDCDVPLVVFIDLNLPPETAEYGMQQWRSEIDATLNDLTGEGRLSGGRGVLLMFTNDPSHYLHEQDVGGEANALWLVHHVIESPLSPAPVDELLRRLSKAFSQRLHSPVDFPD